MVSDNKWTKNPDNISKVKKSFHDRQEYNEGLPIQLHVETAGACNLPCPICPRGKDLIKREGYLKIEDFNQIFDLLSETLNKVIFSGWGEPLLNKNTPLMIAKVVEKKIHATMNTNGILVGDFAKEIVESGLPIINISVDGAVSTSTHLYVEDNTFNQTINGIKQLVDEKQNHNSEYPSIHGQFILNEETIDEIEELTQWAFDLGVNHVKFKRKHEVMPGQRPRSEHKSKQELKKLNQHQLVRSNEDLNFSAITCAHPWESIFLACTGELSVCSWDPYQKINLGKLPENFEDIWNGKIMRTLRKWHSGNITSLGEPCSKCNRLPGYLRFEDASNSALAGS
jgi:radical SAM protein with 4Fe4S-binding SPASM domain